VLRVCLSETALLVCNEINCASSCSCAAAAADDDDDDVCVCVCVIIRYGR